ncbi:hypothetical protein [Pacificoceanicola onchidii]|uniref:hypothetical protein n=1 Tax=Pacificoceanicola onchidii TaxID=2562685 RepID=UPI0010A61BB1|nr:hypothetical protein [Pacificoceanicola onchidii]
MSGQFDDIIRVSDILQERALEKHRKNMAETKRLNDELAQIDDLRKAVQQDGASLNARQMSGADTLWQTWLVTRRATILQEMAMARALEGESLVQARRAQSRFEAAQEMAREEHKKSLERRQLAQTEDLEALGRLRNALGRAF